MLSAGCVGRLLLLLLLLEYKYEKARKIKGRCGAAAALGCSPELLTHCLKGRKKSCPIEMEQKPRVPNSPDSTHPPHRARVDGRPAQCVKRFFLIVTLQTLARYLLFMCLRSLYTSPRRRIKFVFEKYYCLKFNDWVLGRCIDGCSNPRTLIL